MGVTAESLRRGITIGWGTPSALTTSPTPDLNVPAVERESTGQSAQLRSARASGPSSTRASA